MIYLTCSILCGIIFGQIIKLATQKKYQILVVIAVNYMVAALVSGCLIGLKSGFGFHPVAALLGIVVGLAFVVSIFAMFHAVKVGGVAITMSISRVSTMVPALLSIIIWHELPNGAQLAGICLILFALFLFMTDGKPKEGRLSASKSAIGAVFLTSALVMSTPKLVHEIGLDKENLFYLFVLFSTAAVISTTISLLKRSRWHISAVLAGAIFGFFNVIGIWALLIACQRLPGVVVFPIISSTSIILNALIAVGYWKERPKAKSSVGIALAALALILINLK